MSNPNSDILYYYELTEKGRWTPSMKTKKKKLKMNKPRGKTIMTTAKNDLSKRKRRTNQTKIASWNVKTVLTI